MPERAGTTRRGLLAGLGAAGTAALAGCTSFVRVDAETATVERTFAAERVDRVRVADATDDVALTATAGDTLRLEGHKRAVGGTDLAELSVETSLSEGTLSVSTDKPAVVGIGGGEVDLALAVPASVADGATVDTADGDVLVEDVAGDVAARTGDGDVTLRRTGGDVTARTGDGSVTVEEATGTVRAETTDGDVTVDAPGAVDRLSTRDGSVVADVPAVAGSAVVRTSDGDVTVSLGGRLDATVTARTDDGDLTHANALGTVERATERVVSGRVGDGEGDLTVRTNDGDVVLGS